MPTRFLLFRQKSKKTFNHNNSTRNGYTNQTLTRVGQRLFQKKKVSNSETISQTPRFLTRDIWLFVCNKFRFQRHKIILQQFNLY